MRRLFAITLLLALGLGAGIATANPLAGWNAFIIRNSSSTAAPPVINTFAYPNSSVEFVVFEGGQKAALGTNAINGVKVSQITSFHLDRLDTVPTSGSLYGPYFNIWVTDGLGHYAVIANEPSNDEWAADRWAVSSWNDLKIKTCKVYETPGAGAGTSWVHAYAGLASDLTFENIAGLTISPPPAGYITDPANAVGGGAPRELGTNVAYGFNWMFGDTLANYVSGAPGFLVGNYTITASFPVNNLTQGIGYATIQAAVSAANPGDTIQAAAGVYVEQVEITRNLTLQGAGPTTVIRSPVTLALSYSSGSDPNKAIVYIHGATNAVLRNLTVDGAGRGNSNYRFQGVAFWNAGGSLTNCAVTDVMDTPFSGAQHGVGVYANNSGGGPYSLAMTDVTISGFQKNGTALNGVGLSVALNNVTATGAGPTATTAQNGIQISYGAGGTVTGCTVSGIHYNGALNYTATGFLLYAANPVAVTSTQLLQNQINAYFIDSSASFGGTVTGASATKAYDGIYLYNTATAKAGADLHRPLPQPLAEASTPKADKAAMTVAINNATLTGAGVTGMAGIALWSDGGPIALTATGNTISGWDYGVQVYETTPSTVTAACQNNDILNNASYGFWSNTTAPADARHCWWGSISGPQHPTLNPAGTGNAVSNHVLFEPWTGEATLAITPATSGPLTCGSTQLLSFNYTPHALSPAVKGYSVTLETSAGLTFGASDVHFNAMAGVSLPSVQVTEVTAGHKYILDYAVLLPAGTGFSGAATLFTVNVHATGEGTATAHLSGLAFRNVSNGPIPATAGDDAVVTIDCTAPGNVATVTAEPGNREVRVGWTASASPDVAAYEIWRAKWHRTSVSVSAYPEYDDYADDVLPTAPAAYGSWNGGEWVLAGTVPTGTLTFSDTGDTNRGVYFYEVFARDTAGNHSLPATTIDRATNYWLGDVRSEVVGQDYDGLVYIADVSALGAAYGTTVPMDATAAKLDVGPTDDMSRKGIPTTDSRINFEDLMVFAMNFGPGGPPAKTPAAGPAGPAILAWSRVDDVTWSLSLSQPCAGLRGVNVSATLPQGVAVRVEPGALLSGQTSPIFVKNIGANGLDAGLAVFGERASITGSGELLRVVTTAAADLSQLTVIARGADNSKCEVRFETSSNVPTPSVFALSPNVPNPFNPKTKIAFALPTAASVRLAVYAVNGSLVRTLARGEMTAGNHEVTWDGRDDAGHTLASGTYFCRLEAGSFRQVQKMTLMK